MKLRLYFFSLVLLLSLAVRMNGQERPGGGRNTGGTGGIVSNQVTAAVIANFYTNSTPHYIEGLARLGTSTAGRVQASVTNSDNTLFFQFQEEVATAGASSNGIAFKVPPGGWWKFIGLTTTAADGSMALTYYATNGSVTWATSAGNAGSVPGSGVTGSLTNNTTGNAATATTATNKYNDDILDATLPPYNVVADAATECSAGIQLALYTVGYSNVVARTVLLPAGIIIVTNTIILPRTGNRDAGGFLEDGWPATNGYALRGRGINVTFLDARGLATNEILFDFDSAYGTNKLAGFGMSDMKLIGPNMTKTANGFVPNTILTNNYTTGLRIAAPPTYQLAGRWNKFDNLAFWGFGTNTWYQSTTMSEFNNCRFFGASKYDFFSMRNDQLKFETCSFGWQWYFNYPERAVYAGFRSSFYSIGDPGSENYPDMRGAGRSVTFLNCEFFATPRMVEVNYDQVNFDDGCLFDAASYTNMTEMFLLTNSCIVTVKNSSLNNWSESTTNCVVFRAYNNPSKRLVVDSCLFNIGTARLMAQYDGFNPGSGDQTGVQFPQLRSSYGLDHTTPQILHYNTNSTATYHWIGLSDKYWNEDLPLVNPELYLSGWNIPSPAESDAPLYLPGAIWAMPAVANLGRAVFLAPSGRGFTRCKFTAYFQGVAGVTNQSVSLGVFCVRKNSTTGAYINDGSYSITVNTVTAASVASGYIFNSWANDTDARYVWVQFTGGTPTDKVWLTRLNCLAIP